jgi:hypothetical protein
MKNRHFLSFLGIAIAAFSATGTEDTGTHTSSTTSSPSAPAPSSPHAPSTLRENRPAEPQEGGQGADRFDEFVTVQKHVPHEKTRIWPVGDKVGLDLLVKPGVTDKQLAKLVRWYVSVNAAVIIIYDNRVNAEKREAMVADYMGGKLERHIYTWHRNGDLKDWKTVQIPLTPNSD